MKCVMKKGLEKKIEINPECPCTYSCPRHGRCEECRDYHHSMGQKTSCEKQK